MHDPPYYRLYLDSKDKMTVVCLQSFDEPDYHQERFYHDGDGEIYHFEYEDDAIELLNKTFKRDCIDPEYLREENLFDKFKK